MRWVPGGTTLMGSDDFYPEERPVHRVTVDSFWMDTHPVTAAAFHQFVDETGYVTVAERPLDPSLYPDADSDLLVPGSLLLFRQTAGPVPLDDYRNWWEYQPGISWKRPHGLSATDDVDRHPVVHVALEDVEAYADWAGKELAYRGGVGVRSPRWDRRRHLCLGRRALPRRQANGKHMAR
jgi:sulfatase modifying factor 1